MKIFLDTEFYEDGRTIELISIGLVREDGREYYAESTRAQQLCLNSPWLIANVRPHLRGEGFARYRDTLGGEIVDFVGEKPEFWAYYADYDWVALCQIFGTMMQLPKGWPMFCRDVKQLCDSIGNPQLPDQPSAEHDALADARHCKAMHEFVCNEMNRQATSPLT